MISRHMLTALPLLACWTSVAAQEAGKVVFSDDFPCAGHFDYRRTIFPETAERTADFPVQVCTLADGGLMMIFGTTAGPEVDITNRVYIAFSDDEGATWGEPRILADSFEGNIFRNPCCYVHSDGTVFAFYNWVENGFFRIVYQTSSDGGATWGPRVPMDIPTQAGLLSSAIRLRDGRIVLPVYRESPDEAGHWMGCMMLSDDGGKTWTRGADFDVAAPGGAAEPTIAELSDGDLYCLMRTKTGYQYQSWSRDRGETWEKPTQSPFPSPYACAMLLRLASGNLVFIWDNTELSGGGYTPRYPFCVAMSEDDGKTWPHCKMIETGMGQEQLSNHGATQAKSGMIVCVLNRWLGIWDGKEHGPLDCARFDEEWIRSRLDPEKWEEWPAPTGGIRLDNEGVLLVSGAEREDTTYLASKFPLPEGCVIEYTATDIVADPTAANGLFIGDPATPGYVEIAHRGYREPMEVRVEVLNGRVRCEDADGTVVGWTDLPADLDEHARWGFFTRTHGTQGRLRVNSVAVMAG
jgi:hypothetical protein